MPGKKRSRWKPPYVPSYLLKKIEKARESNSTWLGNLWCRNATIIPNMLGLSANVHNGKSFHKVTFGPGMVMHKIGDFVATRVRCTHDKDAKKARRN